MKTEIAMITIFFFLSIILGKFRKNTKQLALVTIRIRIVYWWNAETTITHRDLWLGN